MGIQFSSTALTGAQDIYEPNGPVSVSYGFAGTDTSAFGIPATLTYHGLSTTFYPLSFLYKDTQNPATNMIIHPQTSLLM